MGGSLSKRLASLSTASKLMLGFALVLILTALVAVTGLLALREVSAGAELQQRMSVLGEQVLRMRQSEQAFALSGDSQHAEHLAEQAEAILQAGQTLQGELDSDTAAILAQVEPALADYRSAFARYVELTDNMQLSCKPPTGWWSARPTAWICCRRAGRGWCGPAQELPRRAGR